MFDIFWGVSPIAIARATAIGVGPYAATSHRTCHLGFRFSPSRSMSFLSCIGIPSRNIAAIAVKNEWIFQVTLQQGKTLSNILRALLRSWFLLISTLCLPQGRYGRGIAL
jgi:hypothetical protein